ncbi:MAG: hypothetical protein ACTSU5_22320 [Promethearchaeota archaeon]
MRGKCRASGKGGSGPTYLKHCAKHGGVWVKILTHRKFHVWFENSPEPVEVGFPELRDTLDELNFTGNSDLEEMYEFFLDSQ